MYFAGFRFKNSRNAPEKFASLIAGIVFGGLLGPPLTTEAQEGGYEIASENSLEEGKRGDTGPWGTVVYYPVILEPPASHIRSALYEERSFWNFGGITEEAAFEVLESLGFSNKTLSLLRSAGSWLQSAPGLEVELTDEIIESLTPENRTALAKWFRLNHSEFFDKHVINIEGGDFSAFEEGKVTPETLELVKSVTFPRKNVLSLMDRPYLLRKMGSDQTEKENLLRAILSTRSLIVRLLVDESTDIDSVADYWSRGGINPGVDLILKGVQSTAGVDKVDIVQLLPPLARRYLYGFTNFSEVGAHSIPDCFWTSLQFFKRIASPRSQDRLFLEHYLKYDFDRVEGDTQFGDVICMFDEEENKFIHSFVHITDDIVYTKNGVSPARPFILARKKDMLSVYLDETAFRFEIYRRKLGT